MMCDVGSNWHVLILSQAVEGLRRTLKMTQDNLAASSGSLTRTEINKVERGINKGHAARIQKGLAHGFGLSLQEWDDYLHEKLSLEHVRTRAIQELSQRNKASQQAEKAPKTDETTPEKRTPEPDGHRGRRRRPHAA